MMNPRLNFLKVRNYFIQFCLKNNSNSDASEEKNYLEISEVLRFSILIASSLKMTNRDVAKALTYFYKLIRNCSMNSTKKYKYLYITVCLYIANKSGNGSLIFIDLFIRQYLVEIYKIEKRATLFLEQEKQMIKEKRFGIIEMKILTLIGFECDVDLPFNYLDKYSLYLSHEILSEANVRCNDSYHSPLCLFFHPLEIACATILISSEHQDYSLPQGWENLLSDDIDMSVIKTLKDIINSKIYNRPKKQTQIQNNIDVF